MTRHKVQIGLVVVACCLAGAVLAQWSADSLKVDRPPVDLSFMNRTEAPAGKHGFLGARGDRLVFSDGTPARFWGTNLTAYALFETEKENVRLQARRLAAMGFNLVRFHHHDSPWVDPNIFGAAGRDNTLTLSEEMLERLDWWVKCLKDEGIYVWLDLHVGRKFKVGDGIIGFDEISNGGSDADLKGYNYVNPSIRAAMQLFNEQYLSHLNVYTKVRNKDEPAIVALLGTNENDITHHFTSRLTASDRSPWHASRFSRQAEAFAADHGLPPVRMRSRGYGPAKIFLNDVEQRFHAEMIAHLRRLGVRVPVAVSSIWGDNPLSSLPSLTVGSIVDAHAYGGAGELSKNPLKTPNMMHWLSSRQVAGVPLSVSEWNVEPFPVADRHVMPLYVAAIAIHQGWDVVMQYAYSQIPLNGPGYPSNWHAFNDPALLATLPAAALLFRRGDVTEAVSVYAFTPDKDALFGSAVSPSNSVALRTAAERGKLVIVLPKVDELPWLKPGFVPVGARVIADPDKSLLAAGAVEALSDNGELKRNWQQGTFEINTARTQAALGNIGNRTIELADVSIASGIGNATICVQSLDGKSIARSNSLLLSSSAQSAPKVAKQLPFHSEPVTGQIWIRAPRGLKAYAIGKGNKHVQAVYAKGRYRISLDGIGEANWVLLTQ